jgi:phage terminase Nu1 subunit (DNA packaging protein)
MATTMTELAETFGIARSTLYTWKAAGCPIDQGEEAITAWLQEHRPEEESLAKLIQRAKLAQIEENTRAARLKNDTEEKRLVDLTDVQTEVSELVLMVKTRLEQIPNDLIGEMPADVRAKVHEIATTRIELTLTEMSQWRPTSFTPATA